MGAKQSSVMDEIHRLRNFIPTTFEGTPDMCVHALHMVAREYPEGMCPLFPDYPILQHYFHIDIKKGSIREPIDIIQRLQDGEASAARIMVTIIVFLSGENELHANCLLFDKQTRRALRFEPRGAGTGGYNHARLNAILQAFIDKANAALHLDTPFQFVPPQQYQASVMAQTIEVKQVGGIFKALPPFGPCVLWSVLFAHMYMEIVVRGWWPEEYSIPQGLGPDHHLVVYALQAYPSNMTIFIQAYGHCVVANQSQLQRLTGPRPQFQQIEYI